MDKVDLVIRRGTLVSGEGERRGALAVDRGRIVASGRDDAMPQARQIIDASGLHVLPGIIDTHVHIRDPGKTEREDWLTGTRAASAGGITMILEMPISIPPVHTAAILRERAAHVQPRSLVDFGLYAGASGDNLNEIEPLAQAGAIAFKTFRTRPFPGREQEFVGICCPDAGVMHQVMERTAQTGLVHVVHAEDPRIIDTAAAQARQDGLLGGLAHARSRPEEAELASVAECIALAEATGARLQIAHISTPAVAQLVARAKEAGLSVTAETCPHYLTFTEEALEKWGPFAKCDPPLRTQEAVEGLWDAVREGVIDVIGSDHAPFLYEEKARGLDDISTAPSGLPGLEQFLPFMLTAVSRGRLTLPQLARVTSENAARLFGLWPRKGSLTVGADADLVLVDLAAERVHDHHALQTKARRLAFIYDGMRFQGLPVTTLVRGQVVMQDGAVTGDPGWGQWVTPA